MVSNEEAPQVHGRNVGGGSGDVGGSDAGKMGGSHGPGSSE